ncbi:efflux RND transporter periplasmic adaptor subunit [Afifella sp. YEN Y35]|uniref:efflux RND transporter periplasmic adaptor subunit n=1 Tax=Afifella sp. YEN Y35 TaxID=3388337 RepID=UPI0039E1C5E4
MRIRFSYVLATALAVGISVYMLSGTIIVGGEPKDPPDSIAEREKAGASELVKVQVERHVAQERTSRLEIRGRTSADHLVEVKAQTGGIVEERPIEKGKSVKPGDLLCVIERGARRAQLAQARAQLEQAKVDLEAQQALAGKGYTAKNQIPALKASVDAAQARVEEAELELQRTEVRAPIGGVIQDPIANVGDVVALGGTCATIIDADPMKVIGQVAEQEIGHVKVGQRADITLISGETREGKVSYIAPSADEETRTFRIEITMANADRSVRDGLTARASIPLGEGRAQLLSPSYLTLNDAGEVGVRTVDADNVVHFLPVEIIAPADEGVWVSGLPDEVDIITVGQEYVVGGQKVEAMGPKSAAMKPSTSDTASAAGALR